MPLFVMGLKFEQGECFLAFNSCCPSAALFAGRASATQQQVTIQLSQDDLSPGSTYKARAMFPRLQLLLHLCNTPCRLCFCKMRTG